MSGNSPRSSKRFGSSVKGIHRKKRRRHRNKMLFFEPLEGRIAPGSMLDLLVPPAIAGLLGPEEVPESSGSQSTGSTLPRSEQLILPPFASIPDPALTNSVSARNSVAEDQDQRSVPKRKSLVDLDEYLNVSLQVAANSAIIDAAPTPRSGTDGGGAPSNDSLPFDAMPPREFGPNVGGSQAPESDESTPPAGNPTTPAGTTANGSNVPEFRGTGHASGGANGVGSGTADPPGPRANNGPRQSVPKDFADDYDGNEDGTPDRLQEDVKSLRAGRGNAIITLDAKGSRLRDVQVLDEPHVSSRAVRLPQGMVDFKVDVTPGGSAEVDLILPDGERPDGYFKYDPVAAALSRFDYDGVTGAVINGNIITLHFVDGGRGDVDGLVNGVIHDPGGGGDHGVINLAMLGGIENWTVREHDGKTNPGSVVVEGNDLILREGDSFSVAMERSLVIPSNPTVLTFDYTATFDTTEPDFINDAFEASFVGTDGASLAPTVRLKRDTFFNHTEGEAALLGAGTAVVDETVELDISTLTPGTSGKLVLRLANNDRDTGTTVRIPFGQSLSAVNDSYSVNEDTDLTVAAAGVLNNDAAVTSAMKLSDPQHGQVTLLSDGSFVYVPAANFSGVDTFTYAGVNGQQQSAPATVTITVNPVDDAPGAANDSYSTLEDTALSISATGVLINDSDVDGPALQAVLVNSPAHGTLTLNADGSFLYMPQADYSGVDSFTYRATSNGLQSNIATVSITIGSVDDAPVAVNDSYSMLEDTALSITAAGILSNDSDVDGPALQAALVSGPTYGTLTLNADGSLLYTPSANFTGSDSFTYRATSAGLESTTATVSIHVSAIDDGPQANNDVYTTSEDTALSIGAAAGVLENDVDVDGPPMGSVLVSGPSHGALTLNSDGSFSYTPHANYHGTDSFTYRATSNSLQSDPATVTITVTPVDDEPVAANDSYSTSEDTLLNVAATGVLANDNDPDGPALQAALVSGPSHGTIALNADGSFTYTPGVNYSGSDSFTYRATSNGLQSAPATVMITVNSVDDAPVAVNDTYLTTEDTPLSIAAVGVLTNDSDLDGPALQAVLVSGPQYGALTLNADGSFLYTPAANYNGGDSFTYRVNNGLQSNVATVSLTITAVNDPPKALVDTYTTNRDTVLTMNVSSGVLANDIDTEGQSLTAVLVSNPSNGTVTLNTNGSFTYTPTTGFSGADSFTYKARDASNADSAVTKVTILVGPEVYEVPGGPDSLWVATLAIEAVNLDAQYENELGMYLVESNSGQLGSYLPTATAYDNTALTHPTRQTIFAQPPDGQNNALIGQTYQVVLSGGTKVAFYLIQNSTLQTQLANNPSNSSSLNPKTFFSYSAASPDGFQHFRQSRMASGKMKYEVEDLTGGGDQDYNDLVFSVDTTPTQVEGPIKFLVADNSVDRLFQYNPTGYWVGQPQFDVANTNARGVASNAAGDRRWVIDDNDRVYVYDGNNALLGSWPVSGLSQPEDIATDGTNLWILDAGLDRILYFAGAAALTTSASAVAATSSFALHANNTEPRGLATNGLRLWVTDVTGDRAYAYATSGTHEGNWQLDSNNVQATGITNDPTGASSDLWTVDKTTRKVYRYAGATTLLASSGPVAASSSFSLGLSNTSPEGIADPAMLVWISQVQNAQEGVSAGYFRLQRDQTVGSLTVQYHIDTTSSTATNGTDFSYLPGTSSSGTLGQITFLDGQSTIDIPVDPTGSYNDTVMEGNETLQLVLDSASSCCCCGSESYTLGTPSAATLTISDNDLAPPSVWVDSVQNATEGVNAGYIRLRRDVTTSELTVQYVLDSSTTTNGIDFAYLPGTSSSDSTGDITFAVGAATTDIPVDPTGSYDDLLTEGTETLNIQLQSSCCSCCGPAPYTIGTPSTGSLTIADNDQAPSVWVDSVQNATEGISAGYIRLRRNLATSTLAVQFVISSSTATNGTDFGYLPGTSSVDTIGEITFPAGAATVDLLVDPTGSYNDSLVEGSETVDIQLQTSCCCCGPAPYTVGSPSTGSLTIADNDQAPIVWVDSVLDATEGLSTGYIRLRRDVTTGTVTVAYHVDTATSTASNGVDYASPSGAVTFADGQATIDIMIDPLGVYDDWIAEDDETVQIVLDANSSSSCCCCGTIQYTLGAPSHATLTIVENEPKVWIDATQDAVEGASAGYFRVRRDRTTHVLTVNYRIDAPASAASNGVDFPALPGTSASDLQGSIIFAPGQAWVDIAISPLGSYDDLIYEGNETVQITLETGSGGSSCCCCCISGPGYIVNSPSHATLTIADSESTVWIEQIHDATEGMANGNFRLHRDSSVGELVVTYTFDRINSVGTNGLDLAYLPGTGFSDDTGSVTFVNGQTWVDISLLVTGIYDDDTVEGNETVKIQLQGGANAAYNVGAPSSGTANIIENDLPVQVWVEQVQGAVEGVSKGYVRLHRDVTAGVHTVQYFVDSEASTAELGNDYNYLPGTSRYDRYGEVTFADGQATVDIVIDPTNDSDDLNFEGVERVELLLMISTPVVTGVLILENDMQRPAGWEHLLDVTASVDGDYHVTSWNEKSNTLYADLDLQHVGTAPISGPIYVGIRNLSSPLVNVLGIDGVTPDGIPYYDISDLAFTANDKTFTSGEVIEGVELAFHNSGRIQFHYELVIFGYINRAPEFTSDPVSQVAAGGVYQYDAAATDPERDDLTYDKLIGPADLTIDPTTGRISWQTEAADVGRHSVVLRVHDTGGLWDEQRYDLLVADNPLNRPPRFTSTPIVDAYVNTDYAYLGKAFDPDGDQPLQFSLIEAKRESDGQSLESLDPFWQMHVAPNGLVTWMPPAELVGETVSVLLKVEDGHGGVDQQPFTIYVHGEPGNHPPVIISEPGREFFIPSVINPANGNINPTVVQLDLSPNESATVPVTLNLTPESTFLGADILFVVDESGSMADGHNWIRDMVLDLERELMARGIGSNRYGLVGYGDDTHIVGHSYPVGGENFGTAQELYDATSQLVVFGGTEDGWDGIDHALNEYSFRPGAAVNVILITDEDRDNVNSALLYQSVLADLDAKGAMLNVVVDASFQNGAAQPALGVDFAGNAFVADGAGGFTVTTGGVYVTGNEFTKEDYIDLAWATSGAAWTINPLRQQSSESTVRSLSKAFVEVKGEEIEQQLLVNLVGSSPFFENLSGILDAAQTQPFTFNVEFTSDGLAHVFELQFVQDTTGTLLGRLPVSINAHYYYDVNAIDADGDALTYALVGETYGAQLIPHTGVLTWSPSADGQYEFIVRVADGRGGWDEQVWTINVGIDNQSNVAPVITSSPPTEATAERPIKYQVTATDAGGDNLLYYLMDDPAQGLEIPDGLTIDRRTGLIRWTPSLAQQGQHTFQVQVSDGRLFSVPQTITLDVSVPGGYFNSDPEITSSPLIVTAAGQLYRYAVLASDFDHDPLTYDLAIAPDGMTIDPPSGVIGWLPTINQLGQHRVLVRVHDGRGGVDLQAFDIVNVGTNDPPVVRPKNPASGTPNAIWSYQVEATDLNGDALVYALDADSVARGMAVNSEGLITWTPNEVGDYRIEITLSDGRGGAALLTLSIPVRDNAPPTIALPPFSTLYADEAWTHSVTVNDPNTGDVVTLTLDQASLNRGISLTGTTLSWTPHLIGDFPVTLTANDGQGGTPTLTFTIPVRARPVASAPPQITSTPRGPAYVGQAWSYPISAIDEDDASATLSYTLQSPTSGTNGVTFSPNTGTVTWTPSATGSQSFTVRVTDPHGSYAEQTFNLPAQQTQPANDPPKINSIPSGPATVGLKYQYPLDAYDPNGDALTYSVSSTPAVSGLAIDASGLLTWNAPSAAGSVTIEITVDDGLVQVTQQFTLPVEAPKSGPVISTHPTGPAYVGQPWTYTIAANDPDGDDSLLVYSLQSPAQGSGISFDSSTRTLTWVAGGVGSQNFTLRVTDSQGAYTEQHFTVPAETSPPANQPPVIRSLPPNPTYAARGYVYQVDAYDPNGEQLTYSVDVRSQQLGVQISSAGRLTWLPSLAGDYEITVAVSDGVNPAAEQTFTLHVLSPVAVNAPPEITSQPFGPAVRNRSYQYQATATDPNGDAISWSLDLSQIHVGDRGNLAIDANSGLLTWTPQTEGTFTIVVVADDGNAQALQTFQLKVLDNAPPVITSPPLPRGWINQLFNYPVVASDPNPGDTLTYDLVGEPTDMAINANGEVSWPTPALGTYTITVVVTDQDGATARQTSEVRIDDPANNTPPDITSNPRTEMQLGERFLHQVQATDADGDLLTYTLLSGPAGMTMDSGGLIDWTPGLTAVDGSPRSYSVSVSDGFNTPVQETFTLNVVPQWKNRAPEFSSTPGTNLVAGQRYRYDANAIDPDGDTLTFSLIAGPQDTTINSQTGVVEWHPTVDNVGQHTMTVQVIDSLGLGVRQMVTLTVRPTNRPPRVDNDPLSQAILNQPYTHDVEASDPDGHKLRYTLGAGTNVSGSISVHPDTGVVSWTPTATGVYQIQVDIVDELGLGIALIYPVEALTTAPNTPPQITKLPALEAEANLPWSFSVDTFDPDAGQTVTVTIVSPDPLLASMTFANNELVWTPDVSLVGQLVTFEVHASDGIALAKLQYSVQVHPANSAPTLTAIPDRTIAAGSKFQLDVKAQDPNGDLLQFSLDAASIARGMTIDGHGRIGWSTGNGDLAGSPYNVTVSVSDGRGTSVTDTFTLTVLEDAAGPEVAIYVSSTQADVGQEVVVLVHAIDNVGVDLRTLTLVSVTRAGVTTPLNQVLTLDSTGRARLALTEAFIGTLTFAATATDVNGLSTTATPKTFLVTDPNDASPPTVSLSAPTLRAKLTAPTDVLGSVADELPGVTWELTARPVGGGDIVPIASGTGPVHQALLGRFDATLLRNGFYEISLIATDSGGHQSAATNTVEIEGNLKLGNFTLSFTDLELPVSGLPITVTRTYDTLRSDQDGDFGYGWRLDISDTKVTIDHGDRTEAGTFGYTPFHDGTRIVVTLPDGTQEGFTFYGQQTVAGGMFSTPDYTPQFLPDPGVKSQLVVEDRYLRKFSDGTYIDMETGNDYTPVDPMLGGAYTLKLRNGNEMVIDARTGQLDTIIDRNGNTLTFGPWGIEHSSGRGVRFERDENNRITAILTPDATLTDWTDNPRLQYAYDAAGNLISFTDRTNHTTTFEYRTDHPKYVHYLDRVIDPLGRPAAKTEFDEQGRVRKVIDAAGKTIEYSYDIVGKTQVVRDQLGNATTYTFDSRGNVLHEVDATGVIVKRTFDSKDRLLTETHVVGLDDALSSQSNDLTTTYVHNANGDKIETIDMYGNKTKTTYNEYGAVTAEIDAYGKAVTYAYDIGTGNVRSKQDPFGNVTTFSYDVGGNPTLVGDQFGNISLSASYNSYGEMLTSTPGTGRTNYSSYNENGDAEATWFFEGSGASQVQYLDITVFNEEGREVGTKSAALPSGQFITTGFATVSIPAQYLRATTSGSFDANGNVGEETTEEGLKEEYVYDTQDREVQTRSQSRNAAGQLSWLVVRTVYDDAGRVIAKTDSYPEGTPEPIGGFRTVYDAAGRVKRTERLLGMEVGLLGTGNAVSSLLTAAGTVVSSTSTAYDSAGRPVQTTDPFDRISQTTYNLRGEVVELRHQSYDENNQLVWLVNRTVFDAFGRVSVATDTYVEGASAPIYGTQTVYDEFGRPTRTVRLKNVNISLTDGETSVVSLGIALAVSRIEYDSRGQVRSTVDFDGQGTHYEYDTRGRRTATVSHPLPAYEVGLTGYAIGTLVSLRNEIEFDSEGRIRTQRTNVRHVILPDGSIQRDTSQAIEVTLEYDGQGNQIKTIHPDNTFTLREFDERNQLVAEIDEVGNRKELEYDQQGRLTAVSLPAAPHPTLKDASNNPLMVRPRWQYRYDADGNLIETRDNFAQVSAADIRTDHDGTAGDDTRGTAFAYNSAGQIQFRTLPSGSVEEFRYDDRGRQTLHISFEGVVTRNIYDDTAVGGGRLAVTEFYSTVGAYNNSFGTPSETTTNVYDAFGRILSATHDRSGALQVFSTQYDDQGQVLRKTSPVGNVNYEYDLFGRQTRVFTGHGATYAADAAAPLSDVRYSYDALSRLSRVDTVVRDNTTIDSDTTTAGNQPEPTRYHYDLQGRLDYTELPGAVEDYTFDTFDRLDKVSLFVADEDNANRSDNVQLAEYDYTTRSDGKRLGLIEKFWFDHDSNPATTPIEQTSNYSWTYDDAGRLTSETVDSSNNALDRVEAFLLNLVGNRVTRTVDWGTAPELVDQVFAYTYDSNDRLVQERLDQDNNGTIDQTTLYDWGVTAQNPAGGTQQLSKIVKNGSGLNTSRQVFAYDLQGRLASAITESFDVAGVVSGREQISYRYDIDGLRITAHEATDSNLDGVFSAGEQGERTEYLIDSQNVSGYSQTLVETTFNATGQAIKRVTYTFGHDELTQTVSTLDPTTGTVISTAAHTLSHDGHGSVRMLLDAVGALVQAYSYAAYGELVAIQNSVGQFIGTVNADNLESLALTNLLYSGESFDTRLGQQYLRARWYDPAAGRFGSLDSFAGDPSSPLSLNKYAYTSGDPVTFGDPTGMFDGLVGMLSSMSISSGQRGSHGGAAVQGGLWAQRFKKLIDFYEKVRKLIDKVDDLLDVAETLMSLLELPEILKQMKGLDAYAMGALAAGPPVYAKIVLPKKAQKMFKFVFNMLGKSNKTQEVIGELGTWMMARLMGFRKGDVWIPPVHGPDIMAVHEKIHVWGIFEAKGGTGKLGTTSQHGREMEERWLSRWVLEVDERSKDLSDGTSLTNAWKTYKPMVASVTRLNLALKRAQLKIGVQVYVPRTGAGFNRWKGFS
jgi:RHS repeat-associated protein